MTLDEIVLSLELVPNDSPIGGVARELLRRIKAAQSASVSFDSKRMTSDGKSSRELFIILRTREKLQGKHGSNLDIGLHESIENLELSNSARVWLVTLDTETESFSIWFDETNNVIACIRKRL